MGIFKRAFVSIVRRKTNTVLLFLVIFILGNVLFTTYAVTTSIKATKKQLLKDFSPTIKVEMTNDLKLDEDTGEFIIPQTNPEMAEKVFSKGKDIIKSYDYSIREGGYPEDTIEMQSILPEDIKKMEAGSQSISPGYTIYGTQTRGTTLVNSGDATLIKGKGFSEPDLTEGKPKTVITKQFAKANNLEVGSKLNVSFKLYDFVSIGGGGFTVGDTYYERKEELEVVGIIEVKEIERYLHSNEYKQAKDMNALTHMQENVNTLYMPNSFVNMIRKEKEANIAEHYPEGTKNTPVKTTRVDILPQYTLKDFNDLEKFEKIAREVYKEEDFEFKSIIGEYKLIAKPLESMGSMIDLTFKIMLVSSVVVLGLLLGISVYFRRKEMGVYLALGEKKSSIVLQLLIEVLIIALFATTLAIITSTIWSQVLSENTLNLLTQSNDGYYEALNHSEVGYNRISVEQISNQYQGGFEISTILVSYIIMSFVVIVSQVATLLYLLKLNPKKILM